MPNYFGQYIPVTGLTLGFPGKVSRMGERVITARQVLSTTTNPISFGAGVVIVSDTAGGTYQSIADFIAGSGSFTAAKFAGVAISEVETTLGYPYIPGISVTGNYLPGALAEVLERGSIVVPVPVATGITSQGPVYVRITLNGEIPAGVVGDFEAAADGGNTVQLTNVVFRTGVLDANGMAEITLLNRVAA